MVYSRKPSLKDQFQNRLSIYVYVRVVRFMTKKKAIQVGCLNRFLAYKKLIHVQHLLELLCIKQIADEEGAEFTIAGAHFIKAHFINELLKLKNVISE